MKLPPGIRHWVHAERLGSTQDMARKLAEGGAPARTLVTASVQTRGRGRLGRRWRSGRGGLYLTVLLRPELSPDRLRTVGLGAARAVAGAVGRLGLETQVKSPNDVLIFDRGAWRKTAGILAEASSTGRTTDWLLLGIGLNANNRPPLAAAASLHRALGRRVDLDRVRNALLRGLRRELQPLGAW